MNTLPKPRLTEFMLKGIDLADALTILARWESLTDNELAALGFIEQAMRPSLQLLEGGRQ